MALSGGADLTRDQATAAPPDQLHGARAEWGRTFERASVEVRIGVAHSRMGGPMHMVLTAFLLFLPQT